MLGWSLEVSCHSVWYMCVACFIVFCAHSEELSKLAVREGILAICVILSFISTIYTLFGLYLPLYKGLYLRKSLNQTILP